MLNKLIEINGKINLNKLIIKTGNVNFATLSFKSGVEKQIIEFDEPFPNACLSVVANNSGSNTPSTLFNLIEFINKKTFTIYGENKRTDQNCYANWIAIGY